MTDDRPEAALQIADDKRVRTLTLDRPDALNAFNEALYDAVTIGLRDAAADPEVGAVLLTGAGRAFTAGTDLAELQAMFADPDFKPGEFGFNGLIDALAEFPKPLICAVNGVGLGIGATILGFADLVFMSDTAKLKCPFTSLGVAPEAASSYLLPQLIGRQNAAWVLLSSEWIGAQEAQQMGLAWKICSPDALLAEARRHAELLAAKPLASVMAVKRAMIGPGVAEVAAARKRENAYFAELLGSADNAAALADFNKKD